jgi:BlaI family transcriptional regulator, penicillinase repressor
MPQFTPGELNIMRLLWEHGEMKPSQLQRLFGEPIKNPALRSYLTILMQKRHVTRRKVGKAFLYTAVTPRQNAYRSKLRELVDSFCQGSTQSLLMNLIRSEGLGEKELIELKKLADGDAVQQSETPKGPQKLSSRRNSKGRNKESKR